MIRCFLFGLLLCLYIIICPCNVVLHGGVGEGLLKRNSSGPSHPQGARGTFPCSTTVSTRAQHATQTLRLRAENAQPYCRARAKAVEADMVPPIGPTQSTGGQGEWARCWKGGRRARVIGKPQRSKPSPVGVRTRAPVVRWLVNAKPGKIRKSELALPSTTPTRNRADSKMR